jgi:hypothetical protein
VTFLGDAMAAVVHGVIEIRNLIGQPPVIVGGLAVLSRRQRRQALAWIRAAGGVDVTTDDLDLVTELLRSAARRD